MTKLRNDNPKKEEDNKKVMDFIEKQNGATIRELTDHTGYSHATVYLILGRLRLSRDIYKGVRRSPATQYSKNEIKEEFEYRIENLKKYFISHNN